MSQWFQGFDHLSIGIVATDAHFVIRFWNACMEDWTGIPRETVLGQDLGSRFPRFVEAQYKTRLALLLEGGAPVILSYQLHGTLFQGERKSSGDRVQNVTATYCRESEGIEYILFSVEDRTEVSMRIRAARAEVERRKEAEQALRAALREKDFLMRELNHRVKNNLNMILSFIGLQRSGADNDVCIQGLNDLEGRIQSISALHEALYKGERVDAIQMDTYLRSATEELFHSLKPLRSKARLEYSLEPCALDPKRALYAGIIAVEALTNAMKYAIPAREDAVIKIGLAVKDGGKDLDLSIQDNGPGFPAGAHPTSTDSLGKKLMAIIAEEMGGALSFGNDGGAVVRLGLKPQTQLQVPDLNPNTGTVST